MEKKKYFFTFLYNLALKNKPSVSDENIMQESEEIEDIIKNDNEWVQEYKLIYYSHAIDNK